MKLGARLAKSNTGAPWIRSWSFCASFTSYLASSGSAVLSLSCSSFSPRVRSLGLYGQGPVMGSRHGLAIPAFITAALLVIGSGTWMALKLRWGILDTFFADPWGWAILVGFVLTVYRLLRGAPRYQAHVSAGRSTGRQPPGPRPTPEEGARLGALQTRMLRAGHTTAALLLGAVVSMAAARFHLTHPQS